MELGDLVRKHRERLGLSQAELGRAVGVSQATIDKIESGRTTLSRFLPRIAARLGIPQRELAPFTGAQPPPPEEDYSGRERAYLHVPEEPMFASGPPPDEGDVRRRQDMARRQGDALRSRDFNAKPGLTAAETAELPVYIAGIDAFPIDWVRRPPPLANVHGAYGLLVKDTVMEPEFWPGDVVLVHPHLPPGPQSACVFRTETLSGEHAQLKHLVRFDDAAWHVRQWNPQPGTKGEFMLARKDWPICHRVVGKYSRG